MRGKESEGLRMNSHSHFPLVGNRQLKLALSRAADESRVAAASNALNTRQRTRRCDRQRQRDSHQDCQPSHRRDRRHGRQQPRRCLWAQSRAADEAHHKRLPQRMGYAVAVAIADAFSVTIQQHSGADSPMHAPTYRSSTRFPARQ